MDSILSPKESGAYIATVADYVKINFSAIAEIAKEVVQQLCNGALSISGFSQCEVHPKRADEEAVNWIFVVDTLNFCFWSQGTEKWTVTWNGKTYSGYFALCAAVNRALDEGCSITDPKFYSQISLRDLKHIFRGDNNFNSIPLLNKRLDCLHGVGLALIERFDGRFLNCVLSSNNSATALLKIILENFPCFKDEAVYKGKKVSFYKRAQILIADIWVCFRGEREGYFKDISDLTMFADYRVPQVLVYFDVLQYSESLLEKLKKGVLLSSGSEEEVEIRGCSIHAVELINDEVTKMLKNLNLNNLNYPCERNNVFCNSVLIDHYLWDYRRKNESQLLSIPFHKTLSMFY